MENKHITLKRITYFRNKHFYLSVMKRLNLKEEKEYGNNIHELIFFTKSTYTKIVVPSSKQNSDESNGALFLGKTIGGHIVVREEYNKETYIFNQKNPDYKIDGRYWDLKTVDKNNNERAIKKGVKAKAHQIKDNPGGILLDISMSNIPNHIVRKQINSAMKDTSVSSFVVIARRNNYLIAIYKK